MNTKIKALTHKLNGTYGDLSEIKEQLQDAWNEVFNDSQLVSKAIKDATEASLYQWDKQSEYIESWWRFKDLSNFEDSKEYFEAYVFEHGFTVDWNNELLLFSQGPSIVICDKGDVLDQDSGKFFIKHTDYRDLDSNDLNDGKRDEFIETYMVKHGYFPAVFQTDRNGNVTLVNTSQK